MKRPLNTFLVFGGVFNWLEDWWRTFVRAKVEFEVEPRFCVLLQ